MYLLIIMNVIWASCYTVMKWGLDYLSPMHFLFLRMFISLIVMTAYSARYLRLIDGKLLFRGMMLGAIIATSHGMSFIGIDRSYATDAAILYAVEPVTAIVVARIFLKERMDGWRLLALGLALAGFLILSDVSYRNILSNLTLIGNFFILIGVMADGFFSPVAKPVTENYPARLILTVAIFFTSLIIFPFALLSPVKTTYISWQPVVSLLYLSLLCTCVGWTLWLYFLKKLPVNVIALTVFIQPVLGAFIPHFTIGEEIGARIWLGGCVILTGVAIAVFKRKNCESELVSEAVMH